MIFWTFHCQISILILAHVENSTPSENCSISYVEWIISHFATLFHPEGCKYIMIYCTHIIHPWNTATHGQKRYSFLKNIVTMQVKKWKLAYLSTTKSIYVITQDVLGQHNWPTLYSCQTIFNDHKCSWPEFYISFELKWFRFRNESKGMSTLSVTWDSKQRDQLSRSWSPAQSILDVLSSRRD